MKKNSKIFKAKGKLIISGEYAVLDGAVSFAIPTKFGQSLEVVPLDISDNPFLVWEAYLENGDIWFYAYLDLSDFSVFRYSDKNLADKISTIFQTIREFNPDFLNNSSTNVQCRTYLEFKKEWGLGTSSTLISLLSDYAQIDPFELNKAIFHTSGCDIACARSECPITYQLTELSREIEMINFKPKFLDKLHFVYLNKKQDTQSGVPRDYKSKPKDLFLIKEISEITKKLVKAKSLEEFESLINLHEELLSSHLDIPKVKDLYFKDYEGSVKSLGTWGGDFVLISERKEYLNYFKSKGFSTIFRFQDFVMC